MNILTNDLGFVYFTDKPKGYTLVISPAEFFILKEKKKKFIEENIELVTGAELLVYSPSTQRYYQRKVREYTNPYKEATLMDKLNNKQLFLKFTPEQKRMLGKQVKDSGLSYYAYVKCNEITLEIERIEKWDKYRNDYASRIAMLTNMFNQLKQKR